MSRSTAYPHDDADTPSESGDFHGYLARNLSDAYRLAVITLDDPIEAAAIVRAAIMAVWETAGAWSERDMDDAFRHRLDADVQTAISAAGPAATVVAVEPLEAAVAGLSPRLQVELARSFGPWEPSPTGASRAGRGRDAVEALRALGSRLNSADGAAIGPGDPEPRVRTLYETRDPGETAPLQLRLRLHQDGSDAEAAATERARRARRSGWGFVFNAFLALIVLTLVLALASVVDLRASAVAGGDPTSDPASPLTISGISVLQGGIDGEAVHVGATQRTLIVAFAASPIWHVSSRECSADIVGTIDWLGNTTWIGAQAGHADAIVGDLLSSSAYVVGPGPYCEAGRYVSADGGLTWSAGSLPGEGTSSPTWLAFDPAHARTLLAWYPGVLYVSSDSGLSWTSHKSTVTPLAFDSTGRLVGWTSGSLYESLDEGASWQETGPGPADQPVTAGAEANGVLIGAGDGLRWYPLTAAPSLVQPGSVFSIATLGDGAVVLGADSVGHPWLGAVDTANPGISLGALPPEIASLTVSGGGVAVNDTGAVVCFSGPSSLIALASFAR